MHLTQNVTTLTNNVNNNVSSNAGPSQITGVGQAIPPYDPSKKLSSVEKFVENLEQLSRLNKWDENTIIYIATTNLKGLAKLWYESKQKLDYSWSEWKWEVFPEKIDYHGLLEKNLQRKKREDITYYYKKMALIEAFNFENKEAVNLAIGELRNSEMQATVKARRHTHKLRPVFYNI